jgi:hypothetical protein
MLKIPNKQARMRDALDDFDKYYPKWTKQNIVPPVASISRGIISPSIYEIYRQF